MTQVKTFYLPLSFFTVAIVVIIFTARTPFNLANDLRGLLLPSFLWVVEKENKKSLTRLKARLKYARWIACAT